MSLIEIFFSAWVVGFSGAVMPGPMLTVSINETIRKGMKAGPLIVLGHAILELLLVIGLVAGLSTYIKKSAVTSVIGIAGGAFLLWMGLDMLKSVIRGTVSLNLSGKGLQDKEQRIGPVIAGILTSLSNPYWILWWATVGLGYLTIAKHLGWVGLMTFFTGHVLADFCWYGAVSFAVAKGRKLMSDKVYKGIISVCGAFLLFIALTFIKDGVLKILI